MGPGLWTMLDRRDALNDALVDDDGAALDDEARALVSIVAKNLRIPVATAIGS